MGKYVYGQWLIPIVHYFKTLKCNEFIYEFIVPLVCAIFATILYSNVDLTTHALLKLKEVLPNALAILIGFTIMCITLIATTESANVQEIREKKSERILGSKRISIFRWLLVIFSYSLIAEVGLLIYVFFVAFIMGLIYSDIFYSFLLIIEIVYLLHILLLIIRSITTLYMILGKNQNLN